MNNHYAPSLADEINLSLYEYSSDELKNALSYYLKQAIYYSNQIERDNNNNPIEYDFNEIAIIAGSSYQKLANDYSIFKGSNQRVKKISILGNYLLYNGIVGMYMPLTCESGIPNNVYNIEKPFVMAHEASHRLAIASEEDSNFAAFLACINNDDIRFIYSGYYYAFVYCYSSLSKYNKEEAIKLVNSYQELDNYDLFISDYNNSIDHYNQYKSKLEDISNKINDNYLKLFDQEGTISYGKVCDDLVCYYLEVIKKSH